MGAGLKRLLMAEKERFGAAFGAVGVSVQDLCTYNGWIGVVKKKFWKDMAINK